MKNFLGKQVKLKSYSVKNKLKKYILLLKSGIIIKWCIKKIKILHIFYVFILINY